MDLKKELDNYLFAVEILSTRLTCSNCWHGRKGHCSLYSCECATGVFKRKEKPVLWMSFEDGEECDRKARVETS